MNYTKSLWDNVFGSYFKHVLKVDNQTLNVDTYSQDIYDLKRIIFI